MAVKGPEALPAGLVVAPGPLRALGADAGVEHAPGHEQENRDHETEDEADDGQGGFAQPPVRKGLFLDIAGHCGRIAGSRRVG
jgi:hypothetical protein